MITRTIETEIKITNEFINSLPDLQQETVENLLKVQAEKSAVKLAESRYPKRTADGVRLLDVRRYESNDDFIRNRVTFYGLFEIGLKLKPKGER